MTDPNKKSPDKEIEKIAKEAAKELFTHVDKIQEDFDKKIKEEVDKELRRDPNANSKN